MKIVITGSNGTIGSVLRNYLDSQGHETIAWDRKLTPVDNYQVMEDFLRGSRADALFHLAVASQPTGKENESWLVNYEWSSELAWICRILYIKFIFTSTVMVFSDKNSGPYTIHSVPDAESGYGYEKRMAEGRVFAQNPDGIVVRLGWQIGNAPGSNNMIDFLERQMAEKGKITASTKWLPACSFIADTVQALTELLECEPGLYMIDSNRKWNFYEICRALNLEHGSKWIIEETEDFCYDQRMIESRFNIPPLKSRVANL
jgi:dTDP-4-dehydrorhamnose reductase